MNDAAQDRRRHDIEKLNRLVDGIGIAMLVTTDEAGRLRSRPMAARPLEPDGSLWFFTSAASHKIDEVRGHEQVNLAYINAAEHRYVSISGRASLVRDRARVDELWNSSYATWFPEGRDGPDVALLRVDVDRAEYWDTPARTMVVLFEYARTMLAGKPFEPSHHEQIDLSGTSGRP